MTCRDDDKDVDRQPGAEASDDDEVFDAILRVGFGRPTDVDSSATAQGQTDPYLGLKVGRFKIRELIGANAFSKIYVADTLATSPNKVAIRISRMAAHVPDDLDPIQIQPIRSALTRLTHANLVRVLDIGTTDSGHRFVAHELVVGGAFTKYCDERGLSIHERLVLFRDLCDAIRYAHSENVIHGSIKNSKLMIAYDIEASKVKIVDFGALWLSGADPTEWYPSGKRGDLVALGDRLSELMTGIDPSFVPVYRPPSGNERATTHEAVTRSPLSVMYSQLQAEHQEYVARTRSTRPHELAALLEDLDPLYRATCPDRNDRVFDDVEVLIDEVDKWLRRRLSSGTASIDPEDPSRGGKRPLWIAVWGAVGLVVGLLIWRLMVY